MKYFFILLLSTFTFSNLIALETVKPTKTTQNQTQVDPESNPKEETKPGGLIKTPLSEEITKRISRNDLSCRYISLIMGAMLRQHMSQNQMSSEIEKRVVEQYLKSLDPVKSSFLSSDIANIQNQMKNMEKWLAKQDCKPIDEVQKLYFQRTREASEFAKKFLGKNFKLDKKTTLQLDAEKREYPKNRQAWEDFNGKYLQFQVANFIATDMKEDEAKGWVERRYERAVKKLKEQQESETYASFLDAFARSLDPHSSYLSADDLEDFNIHMNLSLEGIGATLSSQDGYTVVEQLIPGGSAEESGLILNQDKIIAVDKEGGNKLEPVVDMPLKDVVKLIRGPKGTKVTLNILRKTSEGMKNVRVTLQRKKINLEDEAAQITYMNRDMGGKKLKIGVINLPSFYYDSKNPDGRSCYRDVRRLLKEAQKEKVDALVLDLSQNGGGSLEDAVKLTGLFIKTGNIVKTQGARAQTIETLADQDPEVNYSGPLIVHTSRLSASASEILAGALRDYGRAIIVGGDHTFGKGSVQTVLPLPKNLGAYKVTVGMFFVPGGKSTQHGGVDADIVLPGAFSQDEIGEKSLDYSLAPKAIPNFLSEEAYVEKGEGAWIKVSSKIVEDLKKNSSMRVAQNTDFKKIQEELAKIEKKGKLVSVADILDDKDKKKEEKDKKNTRYDSKKRMEEYLKRADVNEAVNVAADYVMALQGVNIVNKTEVSKETKKAN